MVLFLACLCFIRALPEALNSGEELSVGSSCRPQHRRRNRNRTLFKACVWSPIDLAILDSLDRQAQHPWEGTASE